MSARPRVLVLDYGSGNLRSAHRALEQAGAAAEVTTDVALIASADGLVVPGVGAFAACMAGLHAAGAAEVIRERVRAGRPVLGICVGLQVLFESGQEYGDDVAGLGLLPGTVRQLRAPVLPHMGWNTVTAAAGSRLFAGVAQERFYFVHSFAAITARGLVSRAVHGETFVAAVEDGPLWGTQFHPEKSAAAGHAVLTNWVGTL